MTYTADPIRIGDRRIFGGSIATVVGVGVAPRGLVVIIACPDFFPGVRRLVGSQTYNLGPRA